MKFNRKPRVSGVGECPKWLKSTLCKRQFLMQASMLLPTTAEGPSAVAGRGRNVRKNVPRSCSHGSVLLFARTLPTVSTLSGSTETSPLSGTDSSKGRNVERCLTRCRLHCTTAGGGVKLGIERKVMPQLRGISTSLVLRRPSQSGVCAAALQRLSRFAAPRQTGECLGSGLPFGVRRRRRRFGLHRPVNSPPRRIREVSLASKTSDFRLQASGKEASRHGAFSS